MEIVIKKIPEEGLSLHFNSKTTAWFQQVLKTSLGDCYKPEDHGKADFELIRTGQNVDCTGHIACDCYPVCSRCLKIFRHSLDIPIHLLLAPLFESPRQLKIEGKDEVELVKEDMEFTFYEGESFDLGGMIGENLILELPMKPVCTEDCKGLCQTCGKDLNEGECGCRPEQSDLRWSPLKAFKPKE